MAIFDKLDIRKCYREVDGQVYPKNAVITNYAKKDYLSQYRDHKLFYKEYVQEELKNPSISYS